MRGKSVTADDRAAKTVVDARGDEIDVLTDAIRLEKHTTRRGEGKGLILHEQVVVFDADRPVRGETIFKADADGAAPAGVIPSTRCNDASRGVEGSEAAVGYRSAALHVEQCVVPGVADLAGEQAECVDLGAIGLSGESQAGVGTTQIGPVTLSFDTEYPASALPAVTDLTTGDAAGCIVTTFRTDENAGPVCGVVPAVATRTPAAVGA